MTKNGCNLRRTKKLKGRFALGQARYSRKNWAKRLSTSESPSVTYGSIGGLGGRLGDLHPWRVSGKLPLTTKKTTELQATKVEGRGTLGCSAQLESC